MPTRLPPFEVPSGEIWKEEMALLSRQSSYLARTIRLKPRRQQVHLMKAPGLPWVPAFDWDFTRQRDVSPSDVRSGLAGYRTILWNELVLDLDLKHPELKELEWAWPHLRLLAHRLILDARRRGFSPEVSGTGGKGIHLSLFFSDPWGLHGLVGWREMRLALYDRIVVEPLLERVLQRVPRELWGYVVEAHRNGTSDRQGNEVVPSIHLDLGGTWPPQRLIEAVDIRKVVWGDESLGSMLRLPGAKKVRRKTYWPGPLLPAHFDELYAETRFPGEPELVPFQPEWLYLERVPLRHCRSCTVRVPAEEPLHGGTEPMVCLVCKAARAVQAPGTDVTEGLEPRRLASDGGGS